MSFTAPISLPSTGLPRPNDHAPTGPFPWIGLIALSAAVFLSVTSEMLPTGLLPEMSTDLGVSQADIGLADAEGGAHLGQQPGGQHLGGDGEEDGGGEGDQPDPRELAGWCLLIWTGHAGRRQRDGRGK